MGKGLWSLAGVLVAGVAGAVIWWQLQSPLASGVYPVDGNGLNLVFVDAGEETAEFVLPVTWVKAHPFQAIPEVEDVELRDGTGQVIAIIEGEVEVEILYEGSWYERYGLANLSLSLNGHREIIDGGSREMLIREDGLAEVYDLSEMTWVFKGEHQRFDLTDSYRVRMIENEDGNRSFPDDGWDFNGHVPIQEEGDAYSTGYVFSMTGPSGHTLEEIIAWLPGMEDDYFEEELKVQLGAADSDLDEYMDGGTFTGETVTFPLELSEEELLIYFPITGEIRDAIGEGRYTMAPVYRIRDDEGDVYYTGFGGGGGEFYDEQVILPQAE
ncbi:hypothetical protein [Alteribacter natronophilus]|uniref:hypothetical protein n=1 Tax=Alteribacter natronophilus TaxID=2583810 RepID=UPI00110F51C3|nr:hypothetical protein [Alteribacter natronophilus]TMW71402.1 hypothetical protein FGB90_10140 [Alteribacter natronophilus]